MRMFNRKGVSEVVANVLIVLLVIVGVAVIWAVVKPTIQKASDTVQSDCFTVQIEPQSCIIYAGATGNMTNLTIKRNPGAGNFDDIEVVFEDSAGATERVATGIKSTGPNALDELETATASALSSIMRPAKANVALKTNGQLCPMTALAVNCN